MASTTDKTTTFTVNMTTEEIAPSTVALIDEAAAPTSRIRVHLNIRASDIGFEVLHHQLSLLKSDGERSRFVKKQLIKLGMGQTLATLPIATSLTSSDKNIKVDFGLSSRNLGLESLFEDLSKLRSTLERNQHVKRCLYVGLANTKTSSPVNVQLSETRRKEETLLPSQAASNTENSVTNLWTSGALVSTPPVLTDEEAAADRDKKRKSNQAKFAI
jgi:tRNA threonylcarbamoyladenosine modification (KEOPS) complex  Pcc1 subunit